VPKASSPKAEGRKKRTTISKNVLKIKPETTKKTPTTMDVVHETQEVNAGSTEKPDKKEISGLIGNENGCDKAPERTKLELSKIEIADDSTLSVDPSINGTKFLDESNLFYSNLIETGVDTPVNNLTGKNSTIREADDFKSEN
jgi:hypothetical protein